MTSAILERRFRRFLLLLVEAILIGTLTELLFEKHTKETEQFIPFILCALGFFSTLAVLSRPGRGTIRVLRLVMVLVILGSLLGGALHLKTNFEFQTEMHPRVPAFNSLLAAFAGAAPVLAPGMLGLAGVLALAATYYHPALGKRAVEA